MTKSKAIRMKCLDCCYGSHKEVKICHHFNCAFWPFWLGYSVNSPRFKRSRAEVKDKYAEELEVLRLQGEDISRFFGEPINKTEHIEPEIQVDDGDEAEVTASQKNDKNTDEYFEDEGVPGTADDDMPPLLKAMMAAGK